MSRAVLIIEDERAIREELADFLSEEGFSCVLAATGQEGIERVDGRDFDVVLLDVRLPDISGTEVLARLRRLTPESHVVIMTAHPSVDTVVSALRLAVVTIELPPLRERVEDIPALVEQFIARFNRKLWRNTRGVTNETLRRLLRYTWKGNVRELQNVIERAMILEDGDLITPVALPSNFLQRTHPEEKAGPLKDAVREFEWEYIRRILQTTGGDKQLAAELLGVSVSSIYRRLQIFEEEAAQQQDRAAN